MSMSLAKRLGGGFGISIFSLIVVALCAYFGIRVIVKNAREVIDGNMLRGEVIQKEVDHLNWANKVSALLTDDKVTTLDVQTDDHECAFGKWLYGEDRKHAEHLVPALQPLLKEIETPHLSLHHSAIEIKKVFRKADSALPGILAARQVDHLKWADTIRDCFLNREHKLNVQTDPTLCALGKWLQTDQAKKAYADGDAEFRKAWDQLLAVHEKLHHSAIEIGANIAYGELAGAQETAGKINAEFDGIANRIAALLDKGMEEIVDPAKSKAQQAQDAVALAKWSDIDMQMNEAVIQPLNAVRLAAAAVEHGDVTKQWKQYEDALGAFNKGAADWVKLVNLESNLTELARKLHEEVKTWNTASDRFHEALLTKHKADQSIQKAQTNLQRRCHALAA